VALTPLPPPANPAPRTVSDGVIEVPEQHETLRVIEIAPQQTDTGADDPAEPHLVAFDPALDARGELFLFLGGTGAAPQQSALVARQAAANGFHAIGLSYPNGSSVRELCSTNPDDACYEKVELEIANGNDRTPLIDVTPANTIENRLVKLLNYLGMRFPGEGWPGYLEAGTPRWSAIRLGGHAQGGSEAAMLAREHAVPRVCLLEAPTDLITGPGSDRRLPPWLTSGRATPPDSYYGFRHTQSSFPNADAFPLAWTALGLDAFGPETDVDSGEPNYGGSHRLTTAAGPAAGSAGDTHGSVAVDAATPRTLAGEPRFAPVWQNACFS
jgi:hypothetical protein